VRSQVHISIPSNKRRYLTFPTKNPAKMQNTKENDVLKKK
jgi:hypothetical protein